MVLLLVFNGSIKSHDDVYYSSEERQFLPGKFPDEYISFLTSGETCRTFTKSVDKTPLALHFYSLRLLCVFTPTFGLSDWIANL